MYCLFVRGGVRRMPFHNMLLWCIIRISCICGPGCLERLNKAEKVRRALGEKGDQCVRHMGLRSHSSI